MTNVICDVTTCSYYKNNQCYAEVIKIGGKQAPSNDCTCCGSFLQSNVYSNIAEHSQYRGPIDTVCCAVESCKHYDNGECGLSEIKVGGNCKAAYYTETECTSYECKK